MKIFLIAGARPNFMKIAPIARAIANKPGIEYKIVHTGQHYDINMSDIFFEELDIKKPDYQLGAGGGSHSEQTAKIMVEFEKVCLADKPDMVLVVGDVNSTLACSIVAKKMHIPVSHVEAGLRSFDMKMPEEINRMVTDSISDLFFVTEEKGMENLRREGKDEGILHFVGHVMIDNLFFQLSKLNNMNDSSFKFSKFKKDNPKYGVVTLHRPSNVDQKENMQKIFATLNKISNGIPLLFPIHPRTRKNMKDFSIELSANIYLTNPLPYMEFLNLWKDAAFVLTDSGGLQEETTAIGVPCLTVRENTERPITITEGTNELVGTSEKNILEAFSKILNNEWKRGKCPKLWDGKASNRIVDILAKKLSLIN